jgi:hypothetical protein
MKARGARKRKESERLGVICRSRPKKKLAAEKRRETHFLSNEENQKWIEDYVEGETAGERKRVEDAKAALQQEQEDMKHAGIAGLTNREPENTFEEMMVAIGDSVSDLATSDIGDDGEYEDDTETELGKPSEDDERGWVMGTINKTVQQRMERFPQKQMKLHELTQEGCDDAADYFRQSDKKHGLSEIPVPSVV